VLIHFQNAYAANHDPTHFYDSDSFLPDRWLDVDEKGAGSRMRAGSPLANRELYTILSRLIIVFEVFAAKDERDGPILGPLDCNEEMTSLNTQPKPFKIGLRPRDIAKLKENIRVSFEKTRHV
jgi:phenylacetate 2-hydroxylase